MSSVKRRCGRLVPASRRAGLHSCPVCGARRSNMRRHGRSQHPEWTMHRYRSGRSGWYATRLITQFSGLGRKDPFQR